MALRRKSESKRGRGEEMQALKMRLHLCRSPTKYGGVRRSGGGLLSWEDHKGMGRIELW